MRLQAAEPLDRLDGAQRLALEQQLPLEQRAVQLAPSEETLPARHAARLAAPVYDAPWSSETCSGVGAWCGTTSASRSRARRSTRLVSTVRRAPSAGFSQGQRLLVVDDPALLAQLGSTENEELEPWFESAPAHVLVLTREADYHERYTKDDKLQDGAEIEWPVPFWFVDAGAALMLILLAAIDEGLAAGVYGVPVEEERDGGSSSASRPTCASSPARPSDDRSRIRAGAT